MIFFRLWVAWTLFVFVAVNIGNTALRASKGDKSVVGGGAIARMFVVGLAAAGWWYLLWK